MADDSKNVDLWYEFVGCLKRAKELWEDRLAIGLSQAEVEALDPRLQKVFASATVRMAKFDVALPRILDVVRQSGGFDVLIPEPEPEPEPEPLEQLAIDETIPASAWMVGVEESEENDAR